MAMNEFCANILRDSCGDAVELRTGVTVTQVCGEAVELHEDAEDGDESAAAAAPTIEDGSVQWTVMGHPTPPRGTTTGDSTPTAAEIAVVDALVLTMPAPQTMKLLEESVSDRYPPVVFTDAAQPLMAAQWAFGITLPRGAAEDTKSASVELPHTPQAKAAGIEKIVVQTFEANPSVVSIVAHSAPGSKAAPDIELSPAAALEQASGPLGAAIAAGLAAAASSDVSDALVAVAPEACEDACIAALLKSGSSGGAFAHRWRYSTVPATSAADAGLASARDFKLDIRHMTACFDKPRMLGIAGDWCAASCVLPFTAPVPAPPSLVIGSGGMRRTISGRSSPADSRPAGAAPTERSLGAFAAWASGTAVGSQVASAALEGLTPMGLRKKKHWREEETGEVGEEPKIVPEWPVQRDYWKTPDHFETNKAFENSEKARQQGRH